MADQKQDRSVAQKVMNRIRRVTQSDTSRKMYVPLVNSLTVRDGLRMATREWRGPKAVNSYQLRGTELVANLRQPYLDLWVLDEIFRRGTYTIPDDVDRRLRSLDHPLRVLDIGACVGLASLYFLSRFKDAEITAFEPDHVNRSVLEKTVAANPQQNRWTVVGACAGARNGSVSFISDHFLSHIDPTGAAPGASEVPMVDVFPYLESADLVKMDVQGGEWDILGDERFARLKIPAIVLEYHPYLAPSPDAQEAARSLLSQAGYSLGPTVDDHAGEGTMWAWRN